MARCRDGAITVIVADAALLSLALAVAEPSTASTWYVWPELGASPVSVNELRGRGADGLTRPPSR